MYTPPFSVSSKIIDLISEISVQGGYMKCIKNLKIYT